jgi:hypothetical protein
MGSPTSSTGRSEGGRGGVEVAARPSLAALGGTTGWSGTSGMRNDSGTGGAGRDGADAGAGADSRATTDGSGRPAAGAPASDRSGSQSPPPVEPSPPEDGRRDWSVLNNANPIPINNPSRSPRRNERRTMAQNGTRHHRSLTMRAAAG